jgi:hypothetical protein
MYLQHFMYIATFIFLCITCLPVTRLEDYSVQSRSDARSPEHRATLGHQLSDWHVSSPNNEED